MAIILCLKQITTGIKQNKLYNYLERIISCLHIILQGHLFFVSAKKTNSFHFSRYVGKGGLCSHAIWSSSSFVPILLFRLGRWIALLFKNNTQVYYIHSRPFLIDCHCEWKAIKNQVQFPSSVFKSDSISIFFCTENGKFCKLTKRKDKFLSVGPFKRRVFV